MRTPVRAVLCLVLWILACAAPRAPAQSPAEPRTSAKFSGPLREPPDRAADALHLKLEIVFDWEKKELAGKATHTLRALEDRLTAITLDAVNLQVSAVSGPDGAALRYESR